MICCKYIIIIAVGSIYKRKDGYYYYQYRTIGSNGYKKTIGISLGREIDSSQIPKLTEKYDRKFDPKFVNPFKKPTILLQQSINDYLDHRQKLVNRESLSHNTLHSDTSTLKLFSDYCNSVYGFLNIDEVNKKTLQKFKEFREDSVSDTTIGNNLRHLSSFFSYIIENDIIDSNPIKGIKIPKARKRDDDDIMSENEWQILKGFLNKYIDDWLNGKEEYNYFKVMVFLQMNLGLRIGEVSIIKWKKQNEDIGKGVSRSYVYLSENDSLLTINFKKYWRQIKLSELLVKIFKNIPKESFLGRKIRKSTHKTIHHKFVFENPYTQKYYLTNSISRIFTRLLIEVGIDEKYTTHSLRHGFCVECIRKGIDIFKLSKFVGHKVVYMTELYANHLSVSDFDDITEKIIEIK